MNLLAIDCTGRYLRDGRRIINLDHLVYARWEYRRRDPEPEVLHLVLELSGDEAISIADGDEARRVWMRLQSLQMGAGSS